MQDEFRFSNRRPFFILIFIFCIKTHIPQSMSTCEYGCAMRVCSGLVDKEFMYEVHHSQPFRWPQGNIFRMCESFLSTSMFVHTFSLYKHSLYIHGYMNRAHNGWYMKINTVIIELNARCVLRIDVWTGVWWSTKSKCLAFNITYFFFSICRKSWV